MEAPRYVREELLFKGIRFSVSRAVYQKSDSEVFERDIVKFPEAVAVLPILPGRRVLLIKQFRAPLNRFILEIPAGVVEENESPEETAVRELEEEAGYRPMRLVKMGAFTPAPGYSTEILHIFYADELVKVEASPEKYEIIEPITVSLEEAYRWTLSNYITDMKTALAILLYVTKYPDTLEKKE